jgi:hypothetical protein
VYGRCTEFVIYRTEEGEYWPHLLSDSTKFIWLRVDWGKWVDEDNECAVSESDPMDMHSISGIPPATDVAPESYTTEVTSTTDEDDEEFLTSSMEADEPADFSSLSQELLKMDKLESHSTPSLHDSIPSSTLTVVQAKRYRSFIYDLCIHEKEQDIVQWSHLLIAEWWPLFYSRSEETSLLCTVGSTIAQLFRYCRVKNLFRPAATRLQPIPLSTNLDPVGLTRWKELGVFKSKSKSASDFAVFSWVCWEYQCYYRDRCLPEKIIDFLFEFVSRSATTTLEGKYALPTALDVIRQASYMRKSLADIKVIAARVNNLVRCIERLGLAASYSLLAALNALDSTLSSVSYFNSDLIHQEARLKCVDLIAKILETNESLKWKNDTALKICIACMFAMSATYYTKDQNFFQKSVVAATSYTHIVARCCIPRSPRSLHRSLNAAAIRSLSSFLKHPYREGPYMEGLSQISTLISAYADDGVFVNVVLHQDLLPKYLPHWSLFGAEKSLIHLSDILKEQLRFRPRCKLFNLLSDPESVLLSLDESEIVSRDWFEISFAKTAAKSILSSLKLFFPFAKNTFERNAIRPIIEFVLSLRTSIDLDMILYDNDHPISIADPSEQLSTEKSYNALVKIGMNPSAAISLLQMENRKTKWTVDDLFFLLQHLLMELVVAENYDGLKDVFRATYSVKHPFDIFDSLWKFIPYWQRESSIRLGQNYWSLAVSIQQVLPEVHIPIWLAIAACHEPYPSIENLLYTIDHELICTYTDADWIVHFPWIHFVFLTPNLHRCWVIHDVHIQ